MSSWSFFVPIVSLRDLFYAVNNNKTIDEKWVTDNQLLSMTIYILTRALSFDYLGMIKYSISGCHLPRIKIENFKD